MADVHGSISMESELCGKKRNLSRWTSRWLSEFADRQYVGIFALSLIGSPQVWGGGGMMIG